MKEVLIKKEFKKYSTEYYHNFNPINYFDSDDTDDWMSLSQISNKQRPLFRYNCGDTNEDSFELNYGNPMCNVSTRKFMVVVEKYGDKVAMKIFFNTKERRVGVKWFKKQTQMEFISVDTKTGDIYSGRMINYHLKRKCNKSMRRNYFLESRIKLMRNLIIQYFNDEETNEITSRFINEIDNSSHLGGLTNDERLFKFYLTKRKVKFPNNFQTFRNTWFGPEIKKILKKQDNRMIDSVMIRYNLNGKQVKKALHFCLNFNINLYLTAKNLFGDDWLNQDDNIILQCFNSEINFNDTDDFTQFKEYVTTEELKRVFSLFKEMVIDNKLSSHTLYDHIEMYVKLKRYGETDLKWMSFNNESSNFMEEHLEWTNKIQHYVNGRYTRIYPEYSYESIENPINTGNDIYYPILLNNSESYNGESLIQSNCVKTYVGRASSMIVSVRKGNTESNERATIEYKLTNSDGEVNIKRIQSLGRFNGKLNEEWNEVLFNLDKIMLSYIQDKRFETVQIKKECKNGVILNSKSEWDEYGNLFWSDKTYETHSMGHNIINDNNIFF